LKMMSQRQSVRGTRCVGRTLITERGTGGEKVGQRARAPIAAPLVGNGRDSGQNLLWQGAMGARLLCEKRYHKGGRHGQVEPRKGRNGFPKNKRFASRCAGCSHAYSENTRRIERGRQWSRILLTKVHKKLERRRGRPTLQKGIKKGGLFRDSRRPKRSTSGLRQFPRNMERSENVAQPRGVASLEHAEDAGGGRRCKVKEAAE